MASFNTTGIRSFPAAATAMSAFTRVTLNTANGTLITCGATARAIGFLDLDSEASSVNPNALGAVRLPTAPGTRKGIADTAITAYGYVYASNSGYVTGAAGTAGFSANAITLGLALAPSGQLVAATALGSVFEFVYLEGLT